MQKFSKLEQKRYAAEGGAPRGAPGGVELLIGGSRQVGAISLGELHHGAVHLEAAHNHVPAVIRAHRLHVQLAHRLLHLRVEGSVLPIPRWPRRFCSIYNMSTIDSEIISGNFAMGLHTLQDRQLADSLA